MVSRNLWKLGRGLGQKQKRGEDRVSRRTRQNNKRVDRKMESNDSPEIPDRVETSEEHGKEPVVHVRVRWISETRKDPAYKDKYPSVQSI